MLVLRADQITITVAGSAPVSIMVDNFSFEDPPLANGAVSPTVPSWVQISGETGVYNPTAVQFPAGVSDGSNSSYSAGSAIGQTIAETLIADATYTLEVDVGNRADFVFPGYEIQLWVDGTMRASDQTSASPSAGSFATATASFTTTAADIGLAVEIRLLSTGNQVNFDNVGLSSTVCGN